MRSQISQLTLAWQAEILRAELRMRVEQLETRAMEELSLEGDELIEHYGPHNHCSCLNEESPESDVEAEDDAESRPLCS